MPSVTLDNNNSVTIDTMIQSGAPDDNFSGSAVLVVGRSSGTNISRGLMFIDFGLVPNDAIINSAELRLYKESGPAATIQLHYLTQKLTTSTTWNNPKAFEATPSKSFSVSSTNGTVSIDVTQMVQDWISGIKPHNGFLLKAANEDVTGQVTFTSYEGAVTANRPKLIINYTIPSTGKNQVEYIGNSGFQTFFGVQSFQLPIPASAQVGDLLIAHLMVSDSASNPTVVTLPNGWTVQTDKSTGSGRPRVIVATKTMTSSDGGAINVSFDFNRNVQAVLHVYRNVKSILYTTSTLKSTSPYSPLSSIYTTSKDKTLFVVLNAIPGYIVSITPPLSYDEKIDGYPSPDRIGTMELAHRYMHLGRSQSPSDTAFSPSATIYDYWVSVLLVLEPHRNNLPVITLSKPTNNLTLTEGSTYQISGSATDADSGNVVTVKFKIDDGTTYNVTASVSDGTTPLNFSKTLTYLNSRLYDGATPVTPILDDSVTHKLTVWAEDDKGGKSVDAVRNFTVLYNQPPQISGSDQDLGSISAPPSINYTVTDIEHYSFTITEKVGDTIIRSFAGTDGKQETLTIPDDIWITLQPDVTHNLTITATDQYGASSTRTYTFKRTVDGIELETRTPLPADAQPYRMVLTLNAQYPQNAVVNVQVCNNGYDENPTWEDATSAVLNGRPYVFTNTTKTALDWGIRIKISILPGA